MTVTHVILSENRSDKPRAMPPRLVVIHTTESHEEEGEAVDIAHFFQPEPADKSAHLVVDDKDTVRVVPDQYQAYTALGANVDGLHVEICGSAGQGAKGWADDYSQAALRRAADAVRTWCDDYGIPVRHLTTEQVKAGWRGICGHVNVSEAYHLTDHTDPGPTFPWGQFIALIEGDDDMAWTDELKVPGTTETKPAGDMLRYTYARGIRVEAQVEALLDLLQQSSGGAVITVEQLEAATEKALRKVLADAADPG